MTKRRELLILVAAVWVSVFLPIRFLIPDCLFVFFSILFYAAFFAISVLFSADNLAVLALPPFNLRTIQLKCCIFLRKKVFTKI